MRADQALVQAGLVASRSAAQRLIAAGAVRWRAGEGAPWQPLHKAGERVAPQAQWQLADDAELRYVSRAGLKLAAALQRTGVPVAGRRCLDVGQSTGGFTDCLLQA
ncbi:MAG: SAM-dependent methyltransferase, partial [Tepidimonas sp.]|uniref:SAM-dependent methyltransferase n=1 Tax=Tepidimonas sp. TaxID=2002775 RepID=UPI00259ED673